MPSVSQLDRNVMVYTSALGNQKLFIAWGGGIGGFLWG